MEIFLQRKGSTLVPMSAVDEGIIRKIPEGRDFKAKIKRSRNGRHHRLFMAMIQYVADNNEKYSNEKHLMTELKIAVGHYEEHITSDGKLVFTPLSIDFDSMGEDEFKEFKSKVVDVILHKFLPGKTEQEIEQHALHILGFV